MAKGNRPQWKLHALNKRTQAKGQIGAGWNMEGERGSISIKFESFFDVAVLKDPDVIVTLFPEDGKKK